MLRAAAIYQKRMFAAESVNYAVLAVERFQRLNRHGMMTISLASVFLLSVMAYLASMYYFFAVGMALSTRTEMLREIDEANLALTLHIQGKETVFASEHKDIMESMEKISSIKYLTTDNVEVSQRTAPRRTP